MIVIAEIGNSKVEPIVTDCRDVGKLPQSLLQAEKTESGRYCGPKILKRKERNRSLWHQRGLIYKVRQEKISPLLYLRYQIELTYPCLIVQGYWMMIRQGTVCGQHVATSLLYLFTSIIQYVHRSLQIPLESHTPRPHPVIYYCLSVHQHIYTVPASLCNGVN